MDLEDAVMKITTREDLIDFLNNLRWDYELNNKDWEDPTLDHYFEAMGAWVAVMDQFFINHQLPIPEQPTWQLFGHMLLAAKEYE